ncbi:hypothetical protein SAMN04489835_4168 [Mycolicibacterium rutilum]|uniref:Uncharacterized protein n=1 Tax=Mycolicibacterium rutilum TaxID=370526 RepID=A0A1H6KZN2_MYCRU|nr:hypothetical protein [Mycolicibacterium rutilum]SEH79112.1 hypothetical protein SAMN04489835_4168 [Mycolicibacterium rutilum]
MPSPRKIAAAGVVGAAVLAACLILPALGRLATVDGTAPAAAILGVPLAAVLAGTGMRHYGPGRAVAVALAVTAVALAATGALSLVVAVSALNGSSTTLAAGVFLLGTPVTLVLALGFLALQLVPARTDDRLAIPATGNRIA